MDINIHNLSQLKHYLENETMISLDTNVKENVLDEIINNALIRVYDHYTPSYGENGYGPERRGSLLSEENYKIDKQENMKIKITPAAEFNPITKEYNNRGQIEYGLSKNHGNELAGLINYGNGWHGYEYEYVFDESAEDYTEPRPFLDVTYEYLKDGGYRAMLGEALEKRGIRVEY